MLAPGTILQDRYRILRQIGGGGMGVVYLTDDQRLLGRRCAIKQMTPEQLPAQDRAWAAQAFQQEAQMLARLQHPGLTAVTDFFSERGDLFLVMDYVEGETLDDWLQRVPGQRLPLPQALDILRQLCDVLEYLHAQNPPVVFRDLKPGNLMFNAQGQLKLIDFGIARFFKIGQARDTMNLGTPGYAAPEQYGGKGQTDPRSDIYALGVLLHQLLTGYDPTATPFNLPSARSLNPTISPQVDAVIQRALQMQPGLRYQFVSEFRQALLALTPYQMPPAVLYQPTAQVPMASPYQPTQMMPYPQSQPMPQRQPRKAPGGALALIGFGVVAIAVGVIIVLSNRNGTATPAPPAVEVTVPSDSNRQMPSVTVPSPTPISSPTPEAIVQDVVLGRSAGGLNIPMVQVGYTDGPAIVVVGSIEGDQDDTIRTVNQLIDWYRSRPGEIPNHATLYLIASINPDGNSSGSRYNRSGVDLNRNWATYNWRSDAPVPENPNGKAGTGGSSPFSEPETQVLRDLISGLSGSGRMVVVVVLHSSRSLTSGEVFPGYTSAGPHAPSERITREAGSVLGYSYNTEWGAYIPTGELIGWCAEVGIPSVDVVSRRNTGPSLDQMIQVLDTVSR